MRHQPILRLSDLFGVFQTDLDLDVPEAKPPQLIPSPQLDRVMRNLKDGGKIESKRDNKSLIRFHLSLES